MCFLIQLNEGQVSFSLFRQFYANEVVSYNKLYEFRDFCAKKFLGGFLKIAHIASPWVPVPPKTYGGTEAVLNSLVEEQVRQGHEVTLLATGDSQTSARLVSFLSRSL